MIFISFLYSGIPDLALGILKMLIHVCFCDRKKKKKCITTSSLLICSWHYASLSQFVQEMYSIYSKSFLFTSISCVQERFNLNKVNHR